MIKHWTWGFTVILIYLLVNNQCAQVLTRPVLESEITSTLPQQQSNAHILKYDNNANNGAVGYNFAFETSDGVSRKETAILKNAGTPDEAISVQGSVSWVGPDGIQYTLNYLADENGFQPEGEHLPVPPEK
ncbi:endocuticle structural protein SgAbd-6-like [Glossina fuscipes]|uniref:Endocuticle structural protein SgAbd-6-like n=2 Tax=Nemorhina TaxID=44051 RepID=A0A8U0W592_9MUSC|nr:endocuticle structural protein SgAbd-6-like [Glossina fuscipes]KAI9587666.1 hypothetical protein GQX74_003512 [Glossina fuscipes]